MAWVGKGRRGWKGGGEIIAGEASAAADASIRQRTLIPDQRFFGESPPFVHAATETPGCTGGLSRGGRGRGLSEGRSDSANSAGLGLAMGACKEEDKNGENRRVRRRKRRNRTERRKRRKRRWRGRGQRRRVRGRED